MYPDDMVFLYPVVTGLDRRLLSINRTVINSNISTGWYLHSTEF